MLKSVLWVAHALGLAERGPEQADFLRYRPVLANDRLKNELGYTPRYTSEQCFERYRSLRFASETGATA